MSSRAAPHIMVAIAGHIFGLRREDVIELTDNVAWTRFPRAPAGFWGIAVLRGVAYPILAWSAVLELPDPVAPRAFAMVEAEGVPVLLALDRLVGLRGEGVAGGSSRDRATLAIIDLKHDLPLPLCALLRSFPRRQEQAEEAVMRAAAFLSFTLADQVFAAPIEAVERVSEWTAPIRMPSVEGPASHGSDIAGMIDVRGQIIPVASPLRRLGLPEADAGDTAGCFVILRGQQGLGALAVQRVAGIVTLHSDEISPPPGGDGLITGIGTPAEGASLRIIAPELLWQAA